MPKKILKSKNTAKKAVKKQIIVAPTTQKSKSKKITSSSVDYYNCLLTQARNDWFDPVLGKKKKITQCCKDCKLKAPALNETRNQEIKKLIVSYQQVGDSLKKLLQPIK